MVLLYNNMDIPYNITQDDRIAQMIVYNIPHPVIQETMMVNNTEQGSQGFGSMGYKSQPKIHQLCQHPSSQEATLQCMAQSPPISQVTHCYHITTRESPNTWDAPIKYSPLTLPAVN
jgi:hypothetical protein